MPEASRAHEPEYAEDGNFTTIDQTDMTVLIASTLLTLLILPGAALAWLTRRSPCRLLWGLKAAAVGGYVGLTFYLGSWYMLSYYGRYVLLGIFVGAAGYGGWRMRHQVFWTQPVGWQWAGPGLAALLLLLSVVGIYQRNQARHIPAPPINLTLPLHQGPIYVASGGSRTIANPHLKVDTPESRKWRGQRWGLDLVQLCPWGNRASGLFPSALDQYAIFGAPVYAPCSGTVEATEKTRPDLAPPKRDTARKAGNYVLLRCGRDAHVLLAHLKHESVQVQPGDSVSTATRLGQVGNSGNSWEPHLHISAQDSVGASSFLNADPRPMTFDGRFPIRNDLLYPVPEGALEPDLP